MRANFYHIASKFLSVVLGATVLLSVGPSALRTIAQVDLLVAEISLKLGEIGLSVLRACGV